MSNENESLQEDETYGMAQTLISDMTRCVKDEEKYIAYFKQLVEFEYGSKSKNEFIATYKTTYTGSQKKFKGKSKRLEID